MPALNGLTCHVERGPDNSPLHEYGTKYGDGVVSTYLAVPGKSSSFSIHLTSNRYIAPGLSMFVYIDGLYQCNRSRLDLVMPKPGSSRANTEIDLRVREKEERYDKEFLIGREWRFEKLQISEADNVLDENTFRDNVGTIEVVVLRCQSDQFWGGSPEDGNPKMKARAEAANQALKETGASSKREYRSDSSSGNTYKGYFSGGLDGAFDGPADEKDDDKNKTQGQSSSQLTVSHLVPIYSVNPTTPSRIPGAFPPSSSNLVGGSPIPIHGVGSTGPLYQLQSPMFYGGPFWPPSSYIQGSDNRADISHFQGPSGSGVNQQGISSVGQGGEWGAQVNVGDSRSTGNNDGWGSSGNTLPGDVWAANDSTSQNNEWNNNDGLNDGWCSTGDVQQAGAWGEDWNNSAWAAENKQANDDWNAPGDSNNPWDADWGGKGNTTTAGDWNTAADNNADKDQKAAKTVSWDTTTQPSTTSAWTDDNAGSSSQPSTSNAAQDDRTARNKRKKGKGKAKDTSGNASASMDVKPATTAPEPTTSNRRRSVSPPTTPYRKDYWSLWNKPVPMQRPTSPLAADINATNLLPENAAPRLSAEAARATSATHVVQPGVGTFAPRAAKRPIYADNLRTPYAVFVFKYRSGARIAELFGGDAAAAEAPIARTSFRGRMRAWSKDEVVEQLVRAKKLAGYATDSSLEESEEGEGATDALGDPKAAKGDGDNKSGDKKGGDKKDEGAAGGFVSNFSGW